MIVIAAGTWLFLAAGTTVLHAWDRTIATLAIMAGALVLALVAVRIGQHAQDAARTAQRNKEAVRGH